MKVSSTAPLEAIVLPDPPPRGAWWRWLLVGGTLVLVVGLASAAIYGLSLLATGARGDPSDPGALVEHWETPSERLANISAAMNATEVGCSAGELRDFQRLLARVTNASRNGDQDACLACIDLNLLVRRIGRHPVARSEPAQRSWMLKEELQASPLLPSGVGDLSVVRVERARSPDQVLVYAVQADYSQAAAYRWWLARSGRNWRVVDYERLDRAQSLADGWALGGAINRDPHAQNYYSLHTAIDEPDSSYGGYVPTMGSAGVPLETFLAQPLPAIVHDIGRLDLAWAMIAENQPAGALRACAAVRRPAEHPGVHLARAQALALLGRHAQAIDEAHQYQAVAGRDPQALTVLAEAHEALHDFSAAADKWRELLALCPQHGQALGHFCRLADAAQRAELPQMISRLRKPIDAAVGQAQSALYRGDSQTFDALVELIRAQSPDSPALDELAADRLDYEEQHEEAAALYLKAAAAEWLPERKQQRFNDYLSAMNSAGKAAEGYAQADDAQAAFEYLTGGFEEDESVVDAEQLGPLLALHRKRRPNDPMIDYYEGLLLLQKREYAQAEAKFAAATAQGGEDYQREMFRTRRIDALFRQGKRAEAYTLGERSSEVFQQLARLCQQEGQWDELRQLIAQHRNHAIGDHWIDYFQALLHQHRGEYRQALDALRRAENGDEAIKPYCHWIKLDLAIQADALAEVYLASADRQATFNDLAGRLATDADWTRLGQLTALHAGALSGDPAAQDWTTRALFAQGKYAELTAQLTNWPQFALDAQPQTLEALHERLVRSHLRLGQKAEARAAAERASRELQYDVPLVMVLLAEGDFVELRKRLADRTLVRRLLERQLDDDPELRPLLHTAELAEFRQTLVYPWPNHLGGQRGHIVLLLSEPVVLAGDQVQPRLAAAGLSEAVVRPVPPGTDELIQSYAIATPHGAMQVSLGSEPYCQGKDLEFPPTDPALARAIEEHRAYVAVDFQPLVLEPGSEQMLSASSQLAAELCDEHTLAISAFRGTGEHRLALAGDLARERLRSGELLGPSSLRPGGTHSYALFPLTSEDDEPGAAKWVARRKAFRQLAVQAHEGAATPHEVLVNLARGHAREQLWLKVAGASRGAYGNWDLHGELPADSVLWPHLRAGTRVEVGQYEVLAVRDAPP